ncbi:flippase [Candidatus Woesearchaeota archaeon]|nr:flippase [Candidatus Woesearchaeota archaeon]
MALSKEIAKNTGFMFFSELYGKVLSFFLIIFVARYLGDVGLGKYSFAFAFAYIFSIFSDLGTTNWAIREIAKNHKKAEKYFTNVFTLKLSLMVIMLAITFISTFFVKKTNDVRLIVLLAGTVILFENLSNLFVTLFRAFEKMQYVSLLIVIERSIAFGAGILVLYKWKSLLLFLLVLVFSQLISSLAAARIASKRFVKARFCFDIPFMKRMVKVSIPFWFTTLFVIFYFKISTVMLSMMKSYEAVGWFSAAYKLVEALGFIPQLVIFVTYPVMSRLFKENRKMLKVLFGKIVLYLIMLAIPMAIGCTLLADRIIYFIYKDSFLNSTGVLRILIWAEFFVFINYIMGYLLYSIGKEKLFTLSAGVCVLANITLNLVFIPKYSYMGAAVATVITEIINFALLLMFCQKNRFGLNLLKLSYKPLIAGAAMAFFVYYLRNLHILIIIPLAMALYFLILLMTRCFKNEEIELVKSFLPKKN